MAEMALRWRPVALLALLVVLVVVGAACGGDDDDSTSPTKGLGPNPTTFDPGPNSTTFDPGPNSTANGPPTIDGRLKITGECLTLTRPQGNLDLRFTDYQAKDGALVDDRGTPIARNNSHIAVTGFEGSGQNACGKRFDVQSLVTVFPD
jgi:hypothetical protein